MNETEQETCELDEKVWGIVTHNEAAVNMTYKETLLIIKAMGPKYAHEATVVTERVAKAMQSNPVDKGQL